ncbi:MAG TPA: glycosyltransferase family 2 protein [Acidobacteriota bacterium]|nr:glycosyltransferase family 2 protein [Acidobacteriota bacterium]
MTMKPRIAIVVPARDEAESIPHVLADIPSAYSPRIVVVDNGSNDGTGEVAQRLGAEVVLEQQPGYGIACQAGLRHLAAEPPDIAVILDADHSDYPQDLDALLQPILDGDADLVCGSRVHLAEPGALGAHVRWGNGLSTALIGLLFGHTYEDMGPFRAIRWEALQQLQMRDPAYGWNAEMQVKALQHRLRVREVAVRYRARKGRSKISGTLRGTLGAGSGILLTVLYLRFAPRWYARQVPVPPATFS